MRGLGLASKFRIARQSMVIELDHPMLLFGGGVALIVVAIGALLPANEDQQSRSRRLFVPRNRAVLGAGGGQPPFRRGRTIPTLLDIRRL